MKTTQEIFEEIYGKKLWGGRRFFWRRFHSGSGSVGRDVIGPYVDAVRPLITGAVVVDLGCGDFNVGRRLAPSAARYVACDIARPLIEHNRRKFRGIDFRILNAIDDVLPDGEIVLIRQVLQHLDNASVSRVLGKLGKYRAAVITEHIPHHAFIPNLDMPTGAGNRTLIQSGLVLTEPPFSFPTGKVICAVPQHGGLIRTLLHRL